jgi:tetratricopeptide (TPR) repeat protein
MVSACFAVLLFCLPGTLTCSTVSAQTIDSIAELKATVNELMRQTRYTEALPILEKVVIAEPENSKMQFYFGSALLGQSMNTKDPVERRALRVRARNAFIRSKELHIEEPVVEALIDSIPTDGGDGKAFSQNISANALMIQAEGLFAQGKMEGALENYQRALQLDPKLYYAALFSADVFMQKDDFENAELWYQKAIAIDPNKETAYRYSATPLMKQGKKTEARDRYIEAFITEPYNKFTTAGLVQWARATQTSLAHPAIDIPSNVIFDEKGNAKVNLDVGALGSDDGSFAWVSYGVTRTTWHNKRFAEKFPGQNYRHSLAEEAEALREVIGLATADKKTKALSASLAKLKKLNDDGLLEAYILLARPDEGIAQDHPLYLKENREKLRRYVVEYVVTGGGNWQKF